MGRDKSLSLWLQAPVCPGVDPLVDRARSQQLAGEPQKSLTSADDLVGRARSWALQGSCVLRLVGGAASLSD